MAPLRGLPKATPFGRGRLLDGTLARRAPEAVVGVGFRLTFPPVVGDAMRLSSSALFPLVLLFAAPASSLTLTIHDVHLEAAVNPLNGFETREILDWDGSLSVPFAIPDLVAVIPGESQRATVRGTFDHNQITAVVSNRNNNGGSRSSSVLSVHFSVDTDVSYEIEGIYHARGPAYRMSWRVALTSEAEDLYDSTVNHGASHSPTLRSTGSGLTGMLTPGSVYEFRTESLWDPAPGTIRTANGTSTITFSAIPEPSTALLLLTGLLGLASYRRSRIY